MQATVEVLSGLERKMTVKTPSDRVDQAVEKRLNEMKSKLRLPGFRPGKAPMHLLRQRFGDSIRYDVITHLIDATYREAILQEKLTPAGMPSILITQDKAGEPFEYQATLEVYPEITLQSLASVEIENITVDIAQKDVDGMIQQLRQQKAQWTAVDRPSQKGDKLTISFEGRMNGELFEGGSGEDVTLELGSGTTIPGFEEGFTGHAAGESIALTLTFPANYHVTDLASQPVDFKGSIHKVEVAQLPALDDEFAKELGVKEGGIVQLRESVLENMQREAKQKAKGHLKGQLLEKLLELYAMDVPKVLVQEELKQLQEQEKAYLSQANLPSDTTSEPREELHALAKRRVHLGLLFHEFIKQYNLTADPERVDQLIAEMAASYGSDFEMIAKIYRDNKKLHQQLEDKVVEDQLIERLISETKLLEKNMSYAEFKGFKVAQE